MNTGPQGSFSGANVPKFNIWRQQTSIFAMLLPTTTAGPDSTSPAAIIRSRCRACMSSQHYFRLFGAPVTAGRTFTAAEDSPHGGHVVVLSYGLWKSRFGGNPQHRRQQYPARWPALSGRRHHRPKDFVTEVPADLWLPFQFDLNSQDMAHYFAVAARLKPGVTIAAGQRAIQARRRSVPPHLWPGSSWARRTASAWRLSQDHGRRYAHLALGAARAPSASCCSSPAPTSPTCCWSAPPSASANSPPAPPSAQDARTSSASC